MDVIRGAPGDHKVRVVTPLLPEIVEPKPVPVKPGKPKKLKPKYRRFRKILEKEFDHFPWTSRVYGCLANNHVITVRDLVSKTEADLLRLPNFGRRSLEEIKKVLRKSRLHLGMDV
jgi:DNA-directed RNA polymerase alpha subunit